MKKKIILLSSLLLMLMGLQSCTAQSNKSDTFDAGGGHELTVYPVKHGSLRITFDTLEIEVDPVGKLESATDYSTFPKADIILLTHSHFDHFDPEALLKLITPGKTLIITNDDCGNRLQKDLRFKDTKVVRMHNQESYIALGRVKVEAVPAYNTSKGKEQYHPKGRDNGFVLTLGNKKIYIAADTEDVPEMANLKSIDIAFLPCNQPFTMTPAQLAHAVKMFRPAVVYPYHFSKTPIGEIENALSNCGSEVRIRDFQ